MFAAISFAAACVTCVFILLPRLRPRWNQLLQRRVETERHFEFSPNKLTKSDIALLIGVFIVRAIRIRLGLQQRLVGLAEGHPRGSSSTALPTHALTFPFRIFPDNVSAYSTALQKGKFNPTTGSTPESTIAKRDVLGNPTHLSLFLSAISEPAFLILLAQRDCPIQPLGAVNVKNVFKLMEMDLALELVKSASDNASIQAKATARFLPEIRKVKRGIEIDIVVSVWVSSHDKNDPYTEVFQQIFTILEFARWKSPVIEQKTAPSAANVPTADEHSSLSSPKPTVRMHESDPARWAALCLDYNPIHHIKLAARLAGFRGKLAHGNHVAARAIESLGNSFKQFVTTDAEAHDQGFMMEVAFKRPVVVPSNLQVVQVVQSQSAPPHIRQYAVLDQQGKICVTLRLEG